MTVGYQKYLQSDHWKAMRAKKIRNKKWCFVCHSKESLVVHHLKYRRLYDVQSIDIKVMCSRCHNLLHKIKGNGTIKWASRNHKGVMHEIKKLLLPIIAQQTYESEKTKDSEGLPLHIV